MLALSACSSSGATGDDAAGSESGPGSTSAGTGGVDDGASTGASGPSVVGSCAYTSAFTQAAECRDYVGSGWTTADVDAACEALSGQVSIGQACGTDDELGRCVLDGGSDREVQVVAYGTDTAACADQQFGCETFGGGQWEPAEACAGDSGDTGGDGGNGLPVFTPPELICRDPLPGEPTGQSEGGQVCTWQFISGCTEEGRHFEDYASCDAVLTQRPYYPAPANERPTDPDPRLDDPSYVAELDWVRSQIEASACICCHSDAIAPMGAANWAVDAGGNWVETFHDTGLAIGAGWIDSTAFGAYPPEDNNGFDRSIGMPSTDPARMQAFFVAELAHRGRVEADFADVVPFGGPLYTQLVYEPGACENGERVDADGTIHWTGGDARYVYVLDAGSGNPTVPPNLDLPEGTRWRVDVPPDGDPVASGEVRYGEVPSGTSQRFPASGAPTPLVAGQSYYLYVTRDVIQPITRCLFTY